MINLNSLFTTLLYISLKNSTYLPETNSFDSVPDENFFNFCLWLLHIVSSLYIMIKAYKFICYTKMCCDWFPMINPYYWPYSFIQAVANPYFRFWASVLPSLKFKRSSIEIYGIIALEILNALVYFCVRLANLLANLLEYISLVNYPL